MELSIYLGALVGLSLVDIGIPAFVTARRLELRHAWVALLPLGDVAMLGACSGRQGWSRIWPVLVIWVLPLALAVASVAIFLSMSPAEQSASSSGGVPIFGAGIIPFFIIRGLWRDVCWQTEQSDRWIWLAGIPALGALRSWPIAFGTQFIDYAEPDERESTPISGEAQASAHQVPAVERKTAKEAESYFMIGADSPVHPEAAGIPSSSNVGSRWKAPGFRPPSWLLSGGVVLAVVAGFLWIDKSQLHWYAAAAPATATPSARVVKPTAEPDRVVGVIRKCDAGDATAQRVIEAEGCGTSLRQLVRILNDRLEVTVRTGSGGSYVVTVPPTTTVKVGDVWVPR